MNKKLKIGDYVRWCNGDIARITDIKKYKTKEDEYYFDRVLDWHEDRAENDNIVYEGLLELKDFKSSPNIIDLIELRDIVELFEEDDVDEELTGFYEVLAYTTNKKEIGVRNKDGEIDFYPAENLRGIITYEQIESMEYKIGDDK